MPQLPFGTQSYQHESLPLSAQRAVNCYLEPGPPAAKTPAAIVSSFGIKRYITVGSGPLKSGIRVNDLLYIVSGRDLYSVRGTQTKFLGSIPNVFDRVVMASDGTNLVVIADLLMYVWNGSTFTVVGGDFPGYAWMTYLDGYFIGGPGDRRFYLNHTAFDPTVFNALDFASAESSPGNIVAGLTDHREVFLFKNDAVEVWYNAGDADFPLSRTASGFIELGLASKYGVAKADNAPFFAASNGTLVRVNGYTPVRISTTAIEQAIAKFANQSCVAHKWVENGHTMVAFTYAEGTFVYDASTQLWHERQSYGQKNWRAAFVLRGDNVTYVGDSLTNQLGILSSEVFTEWGDPLVSSIVSPTTPNGPHSTLELEYESGVGTDGQGMDPEVMLQYSDDGGRLWSNEIRAALGQRGDFKRKAIFNRLGTPRLGNRVYRSSISDPVRRTLIAAYLNGP